MEVEQNRSADAQVDADRFYSGLRRSRNRVRLPRIRLRIRFSLRMLLIAFVLIGILVVIAARFTVEGAREYFRTEYYAHTRMAPMSDFEGLWEYAPSAEHVTLVLSRGRPHSTVSTAHGWWERVSIELPAMPKPGRIDLSEDDVVVGFGSYWMRSSWEIGKKGADGWLDVTTVSKNHIKIDYHVVIDARSEFANPREVVFQGRASFVLSDRPSDRVIASSGSLFRNSSPAGQAGADSKSPPGSDEAGKLP